MRWLLTFALLVLLLWGVACCAFLISMNMPASDSSERADALIVLTGGNGRVERGFTLLADQSAPVLFISGVGAKVTLAEMLAAHAKPATRDRILHLGSEIVFDYKASSTQTNASEAADFVRQRGYKTIRLITAHYHMSRSLLEFDVALPGVRILREPVVPESFAKQNWWSDPAARRLVWQEFLKTLAASFRIVIDAF